MRVFHCGGKAGREEASKIKLCTHDEVLDKMLIAHCRITSMERLHAGLYILERVFEDNQSMVGIRSLLKDLHKNRHEGGRLTGVRACYQASRRLVLDE